MFYILVTMTHCLPMSTSSATRIESNDSWLIEGSSRELNLPQLNGHFKSEAKASKI